MAVFERAGQRIVHDVTGSGPPVLLLHGFPQTRAMWARIVPVLATRFTCVTADLRGYGESRRPYGARDASAMSFRDMAADQHALMAALGFERFHLVGHDRGARTAHRLALDHGASVASLVVMDIVPTHHLLSTLGQDVARAYYHWFFLAQPPGFPEHLIGLDPDRFFEACLTGWGGDGLAAFDPAALAQYRAQWRRPEVIAAMCDDYRAAIDIDMGHDAADLGRRVACPACVLYGAEGVMAQAYDVAATWQPRLADMTARALPGGHFFPDTHPEATATALLDFLTAR